MVMVMMVMMVMMMIMRTRRIEMVAFVLEYICFVMNARVCVQKDRLADHQIS